jgi:hypothetical protein
MTGSTFDLAPPAKLVDGLLAVPIDIERIEAQLLFDGATSTGQGDATIFFSLGAQAGNPIFDLRQTITAAWLDGVAVATAEVSHHDFGAGAQAALRVLQRTLAAGSSHQLRVTYTLGQPQASTAGSYPPGLLWSAGPRLAFNFGFTDLGAGRYLEAWVPANLIFDQFELRLELRIRNSGVAHAVISNGTVTALAFNHWSVAFPARFTALSPMLELRAADTLQSSSTTTVLPVSGGTAVIECWKLASSAVNLATQAAAIAGLLAKNETAYGPYLHGGRFVAFFTSAGGMEYDGGTTTSPGALAHETFHSWFARGIKPASQADGWWDEGFTTFQDNGADDAQPFDFLAPPVRLCSRDPWQRITAANSYADGFSFWKGMAALLGVAQLNSLMRDLYVAHRGQPVSTAMIEEFLLCKSGNPQVVDGFHRFVYGLPDPAPAPDLWLRDDPADPGAESWGGTFWNSPDLWIRRRDDGGMAHQAPEYGQDNWFHARVRNKAAAGAARHFLVTFHARGYAGTQFRFPADFLPCMAARAEFDLAPGATRIVKARWPRELVPAAGSHTCLLASILSRADRPVAGRHVWEHNNLAQKNLTVVDLQANSFLIIPVVVANWLPSLGEGFFLEVIRSRSSAAFAASLLHASRDAFASAIEAKPFLPFPNRPLSVAATAALDCGAHLPSDQRRSSRDVLTSANPAAILERYPQAWELPFPSGAAASLPCRLPYGRQIVYGLKISVPANAVAGQVIQLDVVQRTQTLARSVGGIAVQINVTK